jgi:hypothetical protein
MSFKDAEIPDNVIDELQKILDDELVKRGIEGKIIVIKILDEKK